MLRQGDEGKGDGRNRQRGEGKIQAASAKGRPRAEHISRRALSRALSRVLRIKSKREELNQQPLPLVTFEKAVSGEQ